VSWPDHAAAAWPPTPGITSLWSLRADLAPGTVRARAASHTAETGRACGSAAVKWDTGGDQNCSARSPSYAHIADSALKVCSGATVIRGTHISHSRVARLVA
jgi:hypothetical protein